MKKKTSFLLRIFTVAAAVLIAAGAGWGAVAGTTAREVSSQVLPERTPEPTPEPAPEEEPMLVELSDVEGTSLEPVLDETGISLMNFSFAQFSQQAEEDPSIDGLRPGIHDERVKDLKLRLIDLDYLEGDDPTDYYGEQTAYSVQLFQRKAGLTQNGIADEKTMEALFAENAPVYVVSLGMTGTDVEELQKQLIKLKYLNISATGYFGTDTRDAVKKFQEKNQLSADGMVGSSTRELLYSPDAVKATDKLATPSPSPTKTKKPTASPGPTKKPKATPTPTKKPKATPTPTKSAKATPTPTKKPTATPTPTKKPEATATPKPTATEKPSSSDLPSPNSSKVEQFISYAETLKGKKYVLGGKGPDVFDCSGFVYYALNHSGAKSLSYMTSGGWAGSSFPTVAKADLKRGDILCFKGHVGIYLGNNSMLDASSEEGKIRVTSNIWSKSYWVSHWICGKRVLY